MYEHGTIIDDELVPTTPSPNQGSPSIVCRQINPSKIDFSILRQWLHLCHSSHRTECPKPTFRRPFPSFRVIDCHRRRIIPAPEDDCAYTALSYVWGPADRSRQRAAASPPPAPGTLPRQEHLPLVIHDAILATLELGYTYLWVDAFCIDQASPADKAFQIANMDLVYARAAVTLIAAAGADSSHGLPGVGARPRQPAQPHARIAPARELVASLPEPGSLVRRSAWAARGWTYQEALLSPRRLFFTDAQACFECASMYCSEAVALPLEALHTKDGDRFRREANLSDMVLFDMRHSAFMDRNVIEYSKRQLSFQADALNALKGIFRQHERMRLVMAGKGPSQVWGVPTQVHWPGGADFENERLKEAAGLGKEDKRRVVARMDFLRGMCWYLEQPGERREGFPSWSWAGWVGKLSETSWERRISEWVEEDTKTEVHFEVAKEDAKDGNSIEVAVEADCGKRAEIVSVDQLRKDDESYEQTRVKLLPYIHITASFVELQLVPAPAGIALRRRQAWNLGRKDQVAKLVATLPSQSGASFISPFFLCQHKLTEEEMTFGETSTTKTWKGLATGYSSQVQLRPTSGVDSDRELIRTPAPFIIVLRDSGKFFERIGDVDLNFLYTSTFPLPAQVEHAREAVDGLVKRIATARIG